MVSFFLALRFILLNTRGLTRKHGIDTRGLRDAFDPGCPIILGPRVSPVTRAGHLGSARHVLMTALSHSIPEIGRTSCPAF